MCKPKLISIIAMNSKTGKTVLIEKLTRYLTAQGYNIGAIKYSYHHFEIDHVGTDSYRHYNSGAKCVSIIGPDMYAIKKKTYKRINYEYLLYLYKDFDLVLLEGFRKINVPTIELVKEKKGKEIVSNKKNLKAIVSDCEIDIPDVKKFKFDDYIDISNWIIKEFLLDEVNILNKLSAK